MTKFKRQNKFLPHLSILLFLLLFPSPSLPGSGSPASINIEQLQEHHCLALNIYWEARSEPVLGQYAVAAVTMNRVRHEAFPNNICQVVKQGGENRHRCQFSWWCDGKSDKPKDKNAWALARQIAWSAFNSDQGDPTDGALFYHATYVSPEWSKKMIRTAQIGNHLFLTNQDGKSQIASAALEPIDRSLLAMRF